MARLRAARRANGDADGWRERERAWCIAYRERRRQGGLTEAQLAQRTGAADSYYGRDLLALALALALALREEVAAGRIRRAGGYLTLVSEAFPPEVLAALRDLAPDDRDGSRFLHARNGRGPVKRWTAGREAANWPDLGDPSTAVLGSR
jgi:hypothetical protein